MGFFKKLFGEKKPEKVEVEIANALEFLEGDISPKRKLLLDESGKKIAEIKHLLLETRASLKALEKAELLAKSARLDKIVGTAKANALRQIGSLLEKLSPPNTSDLKAIKTYCADSILVLQHSGHFGKNVAYAGISFKNEMKELGLLLKSISKGFNSLQNLLDENKAVFLLPVVREKLLDLKAIEKSVASLEQEIAALEKGLEKIALQKSRLKTGLQRLRESSEFKSIASLNEKKAEFLRQKQHAKTELLDMFAKVEKPLHRLDKAAKARKHFLPGKQAEFLHALLLNPFRALKLDPKAETLKQVLVEARKAIESGTVELKEREREKKLAVLQEMLSFDFFSEIFWRFNNLDAQLLSIEKSLKEMPAMEKEAEMLVSIKQAETEESSASQQIESKKAKIAASSKSTQALEAEVQGLLSEATGRIVLIRA